jgi:hypothetical protein
MTKPDDLKPVSQSGNRSAGANVTRLPWWATAIVIVCATLMALGAAIALLSPAMLIGPHANISPANTVYADYLASRNLAIAIMLLCMLAISARRGLASVLLLAALVQIIDAGFDCFEGRWTIAPAVLLLSLMLSAAANTVSRRRLYNASFWQDFQ